MKISVRGEISGGYSLRGALTHLWALPSQIHPDSQGKDLRKIIYWFWQEKKGKKNNSEICPRVFFITKAYPPGERLSLRFILTEEGIPVAPVPSSCPVLPRGEIIKLCYCRNTGEGDSPETLLPKGLRFNHKIIECFCSPYLQHSNEAPV